MKKDPMTFEIVRKLQPIRDSLLGFASLRPTSDLRRVATTIVEREFVAMLADAIRTAAPKATKRQAEAFAALAWREGHASGYEEPLRLAEDYAEALRQ